MNPAPNAGPPGSDEPPGPQELNALLRLLDDETPAVRKRVADRFALCEGDISEWFSTQLHLLRPDELKILEGFLRPAMRANLAKEWLAPSGGASALQEDWESFEYLLRTISDFLHDGLTMRQPLSDALDLLVEEATEAGVSSANELRVHLFGNARLVGNTENYQDVRNSDLAWCIAEGKSNPLGLGLIYMLVGRRLGLEIEGVNFPGHFMCRIFEESIPLIVDCFDKGHLHLQASLLENAELTQPQRIILRQSADPGSILLRLLNNLLSALRKSGRDVDAELVSALRKTLE